MQTKNIVEFKKLVKSLPEGQQTRLPEKIREICNRTEHHEYLKAVALGAYLNLVDEISLTGYMTELPEEVSKDHQYCTAIRDETTSTMIVGENKINATMSVLDFKKKVLYA
jgi:cytochrome b